MMSINKQTSSITCPNRRISSSSSSETRLVLLGRTGSGKSSTANSILGRKVFDTRVSSSSVTQCCRRACGEFRGRHLTVLDTPRLLDIHQTPQEVQRELRRSVSLLYPGPHAILLVIQIGRFTQEEKEVLQKIKKAMGSHALSFSVIVFTHGDVLEEGACVKQWLIDKCSDLAELVAACGGRYCIFNNHNSKNKEQVCELLAEVDNMIQGNGGRFYTIQMLQRAEEDMALELHKERRLVNGRQEMLIKIQEAKIKVWYEREVEMVQQKKQKEMDGIKKKQEMERRMEKVARKREEAFLQEIGKKEEERKIREMLRLKQVQREEEEKREELLEESDNVTKMLGDQLGQEEKMRRPMEEKSQRDQMENERKDRETEIQQKQREQVIRQKEQINRDAFQKELDKLTQTLQEQSRREEEWKKQMEDLLRWQREKNKRDGEIQMENQKTDRRRTDALQQELKVIKMKIEQQVSEENHRRQLEESLQKGRKQTNVEIQTAKQECDVTAHKMSVKKHSAISTVIGYVQEMGLVGLNAVLERVRTPCCIQ